MCLLEFRIDFCVARRIVRDGETQNSIPFGPVARAPVTTPKDGPFRAAIMWLDFELVAFPGVGDRPSDSI